MSDTFTWSLSDTHCALCGKENAGEVEWQRNHDDAEHGDDCWCLAFCWERCGFEVAEDELRRLRGLVEAQQAVIARFKDGWRPAGTDTHWTGWWTDQTSLLFESRDREQMTPAEQQVVYGEQEDQP